MNTSNPSKEDIFKLNSFISCCGIVAENGLFEDILEIATGEREKVEKRTGNVGINIIYGKEQGLGMRTVAPTDRVYSDEGFTFSSPIEIVKNDNDFFLSLEKKPITRVEIIKAPSWYSQSLVRLGETVKLSSILQYELGVLMGTIPSLSGKQECVYTDASKCKFCGLEDKTKNLSPKDYADVVKLAVEENPLIAVNLTAGNTPTKNRGIETYIPFVKAIREVAPLISIEIEVSPPRDLSVIDDLVNVGLTSYMSNLEVFDENTRKLVCPGKSKISLNEYVNAFVQAQKNGLPTYTVLIVGLEEPESTLKGVEFFAKNGITTLPLPFKPIKGAVYENRLPTSPKMFLDVSKEAISIMRTYGVNPMSRDKGSCSLCGGCSVEVNYDRNFGGNLK